MEKEKVTKKQLQRVGVTLSHCFKIIRGSPTFSRHIYNLINGLKEPFYRMCLSAGAREAFRWWLDFSKTFNGYAAILFSNTPCCTVYSDAFSWGYGASYGVDWIVGSFDQAQPSLLFRDMHHHWMPPIAVVTVLY